MDGVSYWHVKVRRSAAAFNVIRKNAGTSDPRIPVGVAENFYHKHELSPRSWARAPGDNVAPLQAGRVHLPQGRASCPSGLFGCEIKASPFLSQETSEIFGCPDFSELMNLESSVRKRKQREKLLAEKENSGRRELWLYQNAKLLSAQNPLLSG